MNRLLCKISMYLTCVTVAIASFIFLSGMYPAYEEGHTEISLNLLDTDILDIENMGKINSKLYQLDTIEDVPVHVPSNFYVGEYIPNPPKTTVEEVDAETLTFDVEIPQEIETGVPTYTPEPTTYYTIGVSLSDAEIRDLATLVFLESGNEPYECQLAVASVIINRMTNDNLSLYDVMYAPNQFSPASIISSSSPSESTLSAVHEVLENGPTIPNYVTFFRASYYHNWSSYIVPYCVYGNTYFSADTRLY